MTTWIGLLRGINVGGKNRLSMADLRRDLQSLNCTQVQTYIQSGNVVFRSKSTSASRLGENIADRIQEIHGFRPTTLVRTLGEMEHAFVRNPFPSAVGEPKSLHFFFLQQPAAAPNIEALKNVKLPSESYVITDRVFCLHAPDGVGRSKLAANVERHLGVVATARNYRTVATLLEMAAS
jgi:uncharacterized protein (DUF1697 family)